MENVDWEVVNKGKKKKPRNYRLIDSPDGTDVANVTNITNNTSPKVHTKTKSHKNKQAIEKGEKEDKTKSTPMKKNIVLKEKEEEITQMPVLEGSVASPVVKIHNNIELGIDIKLPVSYCLWVHDNFMKEWTIDSYKKVCTITNVSEFWKLLNNMDKMGIGINNFFLFKEGIEPVWEHESNRNGGICSLRVITQNAVDVYQDLCSHLMCGKLNLTDEDINGISMSPKNNWTLIKIWNGDKHNDLTLTLNKDIMTKYHDLSIKYKQNAPEF